MPLPYPWNAVEDPLALPAGSLRHEIQIQQQASGQDATGQLLETWSQVHTCFAAISTLSMREVYQMAFVSQVTHRVAIRWPGESIVIKAGQRVLKGNKAYVIQAVENVQERNRILNLLCLEINGEQ